MAVPLLLVTAGLGIAATRGIEPDYEVTGAVQFLGPEVQRVDSENDGFELQPVNPLLGLSGSLGQVAEGVGLSLGSQSTRAEFAENGLEPAYEIGADSRSTLMEFRVESDSSDVAAATIEALIDRIENDLAERQAPFDVPEGDVITIQPLSHNNEPSAGYTDQRRAQLLVLGSAVLFTVLVTGLVDVLLRRRGERRGHRDDEEADGVESGGFGPDGLAADGVGSQLADEVQHAADADPAAVGVEREDVASNGVRREGAPATTR